jgi:proteic killer suppression protein
MRLKIFESPHGNRLEKLSGNRQGQYSIGVNDQWRISFCWKSGYATDVEIIGYHQVITMCNKLLPPMHPGGILLEEFLRPMGISQYRLARAISVPARRINQIVHDKRAITADTALRLSRYSA